MIVRAAKLKEDRPVDKPFEQDAIPRTLKDNEPCTTSQGVSFSSIKRENRTDLTFYLDGGAESSRFIEAFGSQDPDFVYELLRQVANTTPNSRFSDPQAIKFMMSIIRGLKPRDQTEALVGAQMAAVHSATMTAANRLAHAETLAEMDSAERAVNKLGRTFAALVDALKRYRNDGKKNVLVQHISIAEGGQEIVGNLTQCARKSKLQEAAKKMAALTDDRQPAAEIIREPARVKVPLRRPAPAAK
jgi:hypothetical protein